MNKDEIRRKARTARRTLVAGLDDAERDRLELALAAVVAPMLTGPLASYAACGAEIDPRFAERGASPLLFPRVGPGRLSFHAAAYADLMSGHGSILEPSADAPQLTPAVILVPLVAADLRGNRIGQGGGHYDRTLAALRANGPVIAIGLAWEVQIVAAIPADPWDQPLDWLATPQRLVDCRVNR